MIADRITRRKGEVILSFNGGTELMIDPSLVARFSLQADAPFDLGKLLEENLPFSRKKAMAAALDRLERSAVSVSQLREYLFRKHLQAKAVDETISALEKKGFLNDRDLAGGTVDGMMLRKKSTRKIREKLAGRGIDREIIDEKISEIDPEDERQNLTEVLKVKNASLRRYPPAVRKEKLMMAASSRGFSVSDASVIADGLMKDEDNADFIDYYYETGMKKLRSVYAKEKSDREKRMTYFSEMRKKGCPASLAEEILEAFIKEKDAL